MPDRIVNFNGVVHHFPADATDAEVSAVLEAHDAAKATTGPVAPATPQDAGLWEGFKHTLPTPSNIMGMLRMIPENIRQATTGDVVPKRDATQTPLGKVLNGRPREGVGELGGILGQLAAPEMLIGKLRSMAAPPLPTATDTAVWFPERPPPPPGPHLDLSQPIQAGSLTPAELLERSAAAKAQNYQPPPQTPRDPYVHRDLYGKDAQPPPVPEPPANHGFAPGIKVLTPKETPASWTPEAARARLEANDWHSGAEPGSAEARSAEALHRNDRQMDARYRYGLDNEKGAIAPDLLRMLGLPVARYTGAAFGARQLGLPGWAGMAGMGAADLAQAHPEATAQAVRAALLARLAAGNNQTPNER